MRNVDQSGKKTINQNGILHQQMDTFGKTMLEVEKKCIDLAVPQLRPIEICQCEKPIERQVSDPTVRVNTGAPGLKSRGREFLLFQ